MAKNGDGLTIDTTTGLPAVPEGYFWRVAAPEGQSDYYSVELRLRGKRFLSRSTKIGSHPVSRGDISEDEIFHAACYAVQHHKGILRHFERLDPVRADLLGNYPPKRVGGGGRNE
jgi:hypothetical protein